MRTRPILIAAIAIIFCIFTACGQSSAAAKVVFSDETSVVIECTEDGGTLEDALSALSEAGELSYEGSQSEYGLYITGVNGRTADEAAGEYWAIYTTLGEADGVVYSSADYGTYEYDGKTCASASYGASGLPMVKGKIYVITLGKF